MNKLIVTGGAGFIGYNFVRLCNAKGIQTLVIDKLTYAANAEAEKYFAENKIEFIKKDICDITYDDIKHFNADAIVNFAAETHVDNSIKYPDVFVKTNINGTFNLLNIAKEHKIRFHQISTDEVYGDLPLDRKDLKFTTESPINPSSPYSSSKASADLLVLAYVRTYGIEATITRCSNNYGPYQNAEKLIPFTINRFKEGKKMGIYGDGLNVRDWIYVDDHNEAVLHVLNTQKSGVFNVGSNNEIPNIEIVNTIGEIMGIEQSQRYEFIKDRAGHDRRYAIDPESMQSIGWAPKVSFKEGINKTVEFYK